MRHAGACAGHRCSAARRMRSITACGVPRGASSTSSHRAGRVWCRYIVTARRAHHAPVPCTSRRSTSGYVLASKHQSAGVQSSQKSSFLGIYHSAALVMPPTIGGAAAAARARAISVPSAQRVRGGGWVRSCHWRDSFRHWHCAQSEIKNFPTALRVPCPARIASRVHSRRLSSGTGGHWHCAQSEIKNFPTALRVPCPVPCPDDQPATGNPCPVSYAYRVPCPS
jgi:hypothetical protein